MADIWIALLVGCISCFGAGVIYGEERGGRWYRDFTRRLMGDYKELYAMYHSLCSAYAKAYQILEDNGLLGGDDGRPEPEDS